MKESSLIVYFGPMSVFLLTLFFALFNTGVFFVLSKHGILDWYEIHRQRWMPPRCEFCMFFWMAVLELCLWYTFNHCGPFEWSAIAMMFGFALCAAVISSFFANFRVHSTRR